MSDHVPVSEPSPPRIDEDSPWPGLSPFSEADRKFFFGREEETEDLLRLVLRERLTVLFGASGLGKTSLLQAGLFPRLRELDFFPVYVRLDYGEHAQSPQRQIAAVLAQDARAAGVDAPVLPEGSTLWEYLHARTTELWSHKNRLLVPALVFDQFEEIFTRGVFDSLAVRRFIEDIAALVSSIPPRVVGNRLERHPDELAKFDLGTHRYKILIAIREDFYADLDDLKESIPTINLNRMRLANMIGVRAAEAIFSAGGSGRLLTNSMAIQIVRFVGAADGARPDDGSLLTFPIEPALLSVVCRELNEERRRRGRPRITEDLLEGSSVGILERFYADNLADLDPGIRVFIEDRLLTSQGYRESVAYETAVEAPGVSGAALDLLVDRRILRFEYHQGRRRVELTHDRLTNIARASRDRRRADETLAKSEEEARRELARQQEELRHAEEERRRTLQELRRSRRFAFVVTTLLVLALGFLGVAVWLWRDATDARRMAVAATDEAVEARNEALVSRNEAQKAADDANEASYRARLETERADQAEGETKNALTTAQEQRDLAREALTAGYMQEARHRLEQDRNTEALAYLAGALRADPDDAAARQLTFDVLSQTTPLRAELRHETLVRTAAFSSDGSRLVTVSTGPARLWDARTGRLIRDLVDGGDPSAGRAEAAAFSAGTGIIATRAGAEVRFWDAETGALRRTPVSGFNVSLPSSTAGFPAATAVYLTRDGSRLITRALSLFQPNGYVFQAYDTSTGRLVGRTPATPSGVFALSPDSTMMAIAERGRFYLWNVQTGMAAETLSGNVATVRTAEFSSDGRMLVAGFTDGTTQLWDVSARPEAGARPATSAMKHPQSVQIARFLPDGSSVITISTDRILRVWSTRPNPGAPTRVVPFTQDVRSVELSPDGSRAVLLVGDSVRVLDLRSGLTIGLPIEHRSPVRSCVYSPDGARILTVSNDRVARLYEAHAFPRHRLVLVHEAAVGLARFNSNGRYLVTASGSRAVVSRVGATDPVRAFQLGAFVRDAELSGDGTRLMIRDTTDAVHVWDATTGTEIVQFLSRRTASGVAARFSASTMSDDGRRLATLEGDGQAVVWTMDAGRVTSLELPPRNVQTVAFRPGNTQVVTVSADGQVASWDGGKPRETARIPNLNGLRSAVLPSGGRAVAALLNDEPPLRDGATTASSVLVWDLSAQRPAGPLIEPGSPIAGVSVSRDGTTLVTIANRTASLWDVRTGQRRGPDLAHVNLVTAALSDDGDIVATSADATVRLWDAKTGYAIGGPFLHPSLSGVALSPDSQWLLTAGQDRKATLWDLFSGTKADALLLADLAEATAGVRVSVNGRLEEQPDAPVRRDELLARASTAQATDLAANKFVRWFLADPWERPVSPWSTITVTDYVKHLLAGSEASRTEAERAFPGHPLVSATSTPKAQ